MATAHALYTLLAQSQKNSLIFRFESATSEYIFGNFSDLVLTVHADLKGWVV